MGDTTKLDAWIKWLMIASCVVFILVLAVSAVFEASIRVVHVFQALIYVAVVILAGTRSAWGYGAGCFIAAFWNWTNLVHTTFIANGISELSHSFQTGQIQRPDQLIAVLAAAAHFVLIGSCLAGYVQIKPKTRWDSVKFLGGGLLAIGYFAGIIIAFGPQYVPLLRSVFGI
jgi:hypothetical protein